MKWEHTVSKNAQGQSTTVHSPKNMTEYRQLLQHLYKKTGDKRYLKDVHLETASKCIH